jgi:hypothetical protein
MKMEAKDMAARPMGRTIAARKRSGGEGWVSDMESDIEDISILDDVIFPFHPEDSFFLG